tara:strand:- start:18 stop:1040 length:1023 start_codon:yes stop_codon:yes gene_type:complete
MLYKLIFVLFLFFVSSVEAEITEIMYNPSGNDNNGEYVEIIFDEDTSMDGWMVQDSSHSDLIFLLNGTGNSKINLIIEESLVSYGNIDFNIVSVYTAGKAIGNGLGNSGDTVYLYDLNGNLIFDEDYDGSLANGDGNALCFSGSVFICEPNPGIENFEEEEETFEENFTEEQMNHSGHSYIKIDHVENPTSACGIVKINLAFWNNRNKKEEIQAYIQDINVVSRLKINPDRGQTVELPVATCNGTIPPEGEYVLVVDGLGDREMKLVWLKGLVENEGGEGGKYLKNIYIESNINEIQESVNKENIEEFHEESKIPHAGDMAFYLICAVIGLGTYYVLFKL